MGNLKSLAYYKYYLLKRIFQILKYSLNLNYIISNFYYEYCSYWWSRRYWISFRKSIIKPYVKMERILKG